jgi:hypothetical protein
MELEAVALAGPAPAALPAPGVPVQAVCGPIPERLKCQKQRAIVVTASMFSSSEWFDCASELPIDGGSSVRATANVSASSVHARFGEPRNAYMMMIESNSDAVAKLVLSWVQGA